MQTTWILVANSSLAKLFVRQDRKKELQLSGEYNHPESRQKGKELASDRSGHAESKGNGHGAMVSTSAPKEYEAERFATELADVLDGGRLNNEYTRLILVAPPQFHGMLNKQISKHVQDLVFANIQKDYTSEQERGLLNHLDEHLSH
jgi:protein required for attachment to host cells